jgi:polyferredoxin
VPPPTFQLLADAVLTLHAALVMFVIAGLALVPVGNWRGWHWVNGWTFRLTHLAVIAVVVAQAWLGTLCPLTTLEMWLRAHAGAPTYGGSFIQHWVGRALYYDVPAWVFTLGYTVFGLIVLATWWRFPPNSRHRNHGERGTRRT